MMNEDSAPTGSQEFEEAHERLAHPPLAVKAHGSGLPDAARAGFTDMYCALDREWRFTDINGIAERCLHLTRREMLGKVVWEACPQVFNSDFSDHLLPVMEGRIPARFEAECDDLSKWLEVHAYPSSEGVAIYFRDITERKQAEAELIKSHFAQRRLAETQTAILDALPAHIALLDRNGKIISTNAAWRRFAQANGYGKEDYGVGENYLEICERVVGKDAEEARLAAENIRRVLKGESPEFSLEYPCHSPKESSWFKLTVTPLFEDRQGGAVVMHTNITARKLAEDGLRQNKEQLQEAVRQLEAERALLHAVIQQMPAGVIIAEVPGGRLIHNQEVEKIWRHDFRPSYEEWKGFHADGRPYQSDDWPLRRSIHHGEVVVREEIRIERGDGTQGVVEANSAPIRDQEGNTIAGVITFQDVSERKSLEEQFLQSQKMESVGRLAGGVAHDFNNLLTAIMGYGQLAAMSVTPGDPLHLALEEINKAGRRAADLTRQLLAFSRKQVLQPRVINLNAVVAETEKMLCRLIGEHITLLTRPAPSLWDVLADPGQIQQVIMNLAVNARDAMPDGGKLVIETANVDLDEAYAKHHVDAAPGSFVMLAMTDAGCGMDAHTLTRIFEPFFTTKGPGKGTGLGLSTVYGIVKQSGGHLSVVSAPGQGSTFRIYLPRVTEAVEAQEENAAVQELPGGRETILLVEDEALVRKMAAQVLRGVGYDLIEAANGKEALQIVREGNREIDLVLTDVVMPQMSGKTLATCLADLRPAAKILYISGYTDNEMSHHGILEPGVNFLHKPFTPAALAQKVREVLDQ
ncbi:MAG TPA: PAS domain-containing protein [Blastocatellia bacterium]|nr:PAS domain-containing protein [Blastocatellia bacterium]